MVTLAVVLSFVSVWGLLASAKKVEFEKKGTTLLLSKNTGAAKVVALVSFLISTIVFCFLFGSTVGIISSGVLWMILASLTLLFAPFPKLSYRFLAGMIVLCVVFELLFHFIF